MHDSYSDIRSRIAEEPVWYDINAVPRYDQPHVPLHLMGRIKCQNCDKEFWVSLTDNVYHHAGIPGLWDINVETNPEEYARLTEKRGYYTVVRPETNKDYGACLHLRLKRNWRFGDPPRHNCIGDTMNSIPEYEWEDNTNG